jgi:peptidoglycan hydrolase CwlO-like protein
MLPLFAVLAAGPAAAGDLASLQSRAQKIADQVSGLERRLADLETTADRLEDAIAATTQELGAAELELEAAERFAMDAQALFEARAINAYKSGGSNELAMILSATNLADLEAMSQISGHVARADARALTELSRAQTTAQAAEDELEERKSKLIEDKAEADAITESIGTTLADRRSILGELTSEIDRLEAQARRAAERAAKARAISVPQAFLNILAPAGPSPNIPDGFAGTSVVIEGLASWYGPGFEGNLTASGDVFDSSLYTVASKELPLGTWLYVEHDGRGVVVFVNDRGPYIGERILDLSKAAAEAIGIMHSGVGWVKAEIILKA